MTAVTLATCISLNLLVWADAAFPQKEQADPDAKCPHTSPWEIGDEVKLLQVSSDVAVRKRAGSGTREVGSAFEKHEPFAMNAQREGRLSIADHSLTSGSFVDHPNGPPKPAKWKFNKFHVAIAVAAAVGAFTLGVLVFSWFMAYLENEEKRSEEASRKANSIKNPAIPQGKKSSQPVKSPRKDIKGNGASTSAAVTAAIAQENEKEQEQAKSADAASDASDSANESEQERETGASCGKVIFAFVIYFPGQVLSGTFVSLILIIQQVLVLPLRPCGGCLLAYALRVFGTMTSILYCTFVSMNHGEKSYGRVIEGFETIDDFVETHGAIKRKNLRRNYKAAAKALETNGIEVSLCPAGTWRFNREIRDLIWHQCLRHQERAHSYADITNCRQPVPVWLFYLGEIAVIWAFPCEIQTFRAPDQTLVAINTRMHIGNVYFQPNYCCLEDYSKLGIYAWSHWHVMTEAIRLKASVVNFMPTMRAPKKALGLRSLSVCTLIWAICTWARSPREVPFEEAPGTGKSSTTSNSKVPCAGGKRAARKKAALAEAGAAPRPEVTPPDGPSEEAAGSTSSGSKAPCSGGKRAARKKAALEEPAASPQPVRGAQSEMRPSPQKPGASPTTSARPTASPPQQRAKAPQSENRPSSPKPSTPPAAYFEPDAPEVTPPPQKSVGAAQSEERPSYPEPAASRKPNSLQLASTGASPEPEADLEELPSCPKPLASTGASPELDADVEEQEPPPRQQPALAAQAEEQQYSPKPVIASPRLDASPPPPSVGTAHSEERSPSPKSGDSLVASTKPDAKPRQRSEERPSS